MAKPVLNALASGNATELERYGDALPIDFEDRLRQARRELEVGDGAPSRDGLQPTLELCELKPTVGPATEPGEHLAPEMVLGTNLAPAPATPIKRKSRSRRLAPSPGSLPGMIALAQKRGVAPYEALQEQRILRPISEYFFTQAAREEQNIGQAAA